MRDERIARTEADVLRLAPIDGAYRVRFAGPAAAPARTREWETWDLQRHSPRGPRLWSAPTYLGLHISHYDDFFVNHEIVGPIVEP